MNARLLALLALAVGLVIPAADADAQSGQLKPETVMVTLHARPGSEAELQKVLDEHWNTAHEKHLVSDAPHWTVRGTEEGKKVYFVDVFTWRDASIPDAAPPEIRKLWDRMNALVESRGGRQGLEFVPVEVVSK